MKFYFDTHLHLDLYSDVESIINQINKYKSYTIAVTNLPILYEIAIKNIKYTKYVRFALGLHPELIHDFPEQIPVFFKKIKRARYIGEVGLDFSKKYLPYKDLQLDFFKRCIKECNSLENKILSIHSRNATKEVINIIGPEFKGKVILHWFNGSISDLNKALDYGYFFSVNDEMVKSVKGKEIIKCLPLDRILLESDGPFTKTFKDKYDIEYINELIISISKLKECEIEALNQTLRKNFKSVLN